MGRFTLPGFHFRRRRAEKRAQRVRNQLALAGHAGHASRIIDGYSIGVESRITVERKGWYDRRYYVIVEPR